MRTLLLTLIGAACAVLSLTWSAPACAGADERARVEAASLLTSCGAVAETRRAACESHRRQFVEEYQRAKAADIRGARAIASALALGYEGIERNFAEACAWYLVVAVSAGPQAHDGDQENVRFACGRLDAATRALAQRRAEQLVVEIALAPVRRPPPRPAPPRPRVLDSEARPLEASPPGR